MNTQVVNVTLTALNGDLSIPKRFITLSHERRSIPIGRASKSVAKKLLGAADNAWFDSPVMSRCHAELRWAPENMVLAIEDIGSMHGTFLNESEVPKGIAMAISNGDELIFGAEVKRGIEIFPACAFRVNYNALPYKAPNVFTCPESSDLEEEGEEDYSDFSEDDLEVPGLDHQYSSEDGASIELSPPKPSQPFDAIDLTSDESPEGNLSNCVDLTGETEPEKEIMGVMAGRPIDSDENANAVSIGMYAENLPTVDNSDDEDGFSSLDDRSESNDSRDSEHERLADTIFEDVTDDVGDSEIEASVGDSDIDSDAGSVVADVDSPERTMVSKLPQYAIAADQDPVVRLSNIRTNIELQELEEDEFDLSEAEEEGMRASYGDVSSPHWVAEDDNGDDTNLDNASPRDVFPSAILFSDSSNSGKIDDSHVQATHLSNAAFIDPPSSLNRQPSPSDAAMVKSAHPFRRVSVCDLGVTGDYNSQSLGEKSGKSAYFAAREANKAVFGTGAMSAFPILSAAGRLFPADRAANAFLDKVSRSKDAKTAGPGSKALSGADLERPNSTPGSTITPTDTTMLDGFTAEQSAGSFEAGKYFKRRSNVSGLKNPVPSIPTRDFCSFLDKPDQSSVPKRAASPVLDMTSSHIYNTSKMAQISKSEPNQYPRSAIKIPDIIDTSSPSLQVNSLKRKSKYMSDVTDSELRNWAESKVSNIVRKTELHTEQANGVEGFLNVTAESNASNPRPTKRLKRVLENVSYVALGGATIFAALVLSAPTLA